MNIYIVNNVWEVFISLVDLVNRKEEKSVFLLNESVIDKKIIKNLKKEFEVISYNFSENKIKKFILFLFRKKIYIPFLISKLKIEKCRIVSFSDQDVVTRYFLDRKMYIELYEHGIINYKNEFSSFSQKIKKNIFFMEKPYGRNKYVKYVYLKFPEKAPEDIKEKVKKLDLEKWIEKISDKEKRKILEIFEASKLNNSIGKNVAILLTQPLEIKRCTLEEKKKIYQDIYKKYSKNYQVYIKSHPLEKTEYTFIVSKEKIINGILPIEIFLLMSEKTKLMITLYSSGVFSFEGISNIHFLGTEYLKNFKGERYKRKIIERISD